MFESSVPRLGIVLAATAMPAACAGCGAVPDETDVRHATKLTADTVFLVRLPQGWTVAAAGCRPQPEGPYDCAVEV